MMSTMCRRFTGETQLKTPCRAITSAWDGPTSRSSARSSNDASSNAQLSSRASVAHCRARSTWAGLKSHAQTSADGFVAAIVHAVSPRPQPSSTYVNGLVVSTGGCRLSTEASDSQTGVISR